MLVVFTPTYRFGGLAEQAWALKQQSYTNFVWVIGDDLYEERKDIVGRELKRMGLNHVHFRPKPKPEGYFSNLPAIYNEGIELAVEMGCELFISLQDHIWVPKDGLECFLRMHRLMPRDLLTGLTSITKDPYPGDIHDPRGLWTIFEEPFRGMPKEYWWEDSRKTDNYPGQTGYVEGNPVEWEQNWAATPSYILHAGIRFDESYGEHIAYENQEFAWQCFLGLGARIMIDMDNEALSFPHKQYWPEHEEEGLPHALANKEMHELRYGERQAEFLQERLIREGKLPA